MVYRMPPGFNRYAYSEHKALLIIRRRKFFALKCGSGKQIKILYIWPKHKNYGDDNNIHRFKNKKKIVSTYTNSNSNMNMILIIPFSK